jgi:hypothetical protein
MKRSKQRLSAPHHPRQKHRCATDLATPNELREYGEFGFEVGPT